ncbi:MAG: NADH-quinone oxidoreductase subunit NuoH [Nitrospirae bacterium CG22_combo_CG10-13_8_21_14_all_44_11]|nr:MAG: NADH-quinone oxidoreductase subunit NuoH [Nitrospirae bacterium CG22_combo_CG10-13_8_21_14_all_44_11]PIV41267.1 MAG: NADH-quinone oxidoreductase subunit NuoH [Nitrospirae bacterium CG02_land_8_20_14_3_00_44_33]PJA81451.1 MAG: NADH-quinone oxidoreductase subunit NuoH [Nitrospirae bacterium CG_4_9_14_3_um_filter_44_28]
MYSLADIIYRRMTETFGASDFLEPLFTIVSYLLPCIAILGIVSLISGALTLLERKISADIQNRIGPNRVGPFGIFQFIVDGVKLLLKEDIIPDAADKKLFRLAPYIVFSSTVLAVIVIPFGGPFIVADLNIGLLFIVVVSSLVVVGFMMSGWASNNKWALLGGIRSAAQIISYEIPVALSLLTVALITGTFSMQEIVKQQGLYPWQWFILHNPFTFIAFFIYFVSSLAEINRLPFDFPEAESELVSGYNTEYSGMRFGFFFVAEFANIFVSAALAAAVFLGGGNIGLDPYNSPLGYKLLMALVFFAKALSLCLVTIWVRWTLPRLRIDHMMSLCWKYFIPISVFCLVLTAAWLVAFKGNGVFWRIAG